MVVKKIKIIFHLHLDNYPITYHNLDNIVFKHLFLYYTNLNN